MIGVAETAIYSTLAGTSAITDIVGTRIYSGMAKEGDARPCIIFNLIGGSDWQHSGGNGVAGSVMRFAIEGYADGESYPHDLAAEIDQALTGQQIGVSDSATNWTVDFIRIRPISLAEHHSGKEIRRSGFVFEVIARKD